MKIFLTALLIITSSRSYAAKYTLGGSTETKILKYSNDFDKSPGYKSQFLFEQKADISKSIKGLNQIKANASSLLNDFKGSINNENDKSFEVYPGENYLSLQNPNWIFQVGYQNIIWGEAFGFDYANIINPGDNRITLYDSVQNKKIPIPLLNFKYFFSSSSLQFIYSPRPYFSKNLPLDILLGNSLSLSNATLKKDIQPAFFEENEYAFKLSTTINSFDFSLFYFNHISRNPFYQILQLSPTGITLTEKHQRMTTYGFSGAVSFDDLIIRSDIVYNQDVQINYIAQGFLSNYTANSINTLVSLEYPIIDKLNSMIIISNKKIQNYLLNSFEYEDEYQAIFRLVKDLGEEKNFDISYTRNLQDNGNAIQFTVNWPISNNTIITLGNESYFGEETSNFKKINKLNNTFFSIKNFFDL